MAAGLLFACSGGDSERATRVAPDVATASGAEDPGAATIADAAASERELAIIPAPVRVERREGVFILSKETPVIASAGAPGAETAARYFVETLKKTTGVELSIERAPSSDRPAIRFGAVDGKGLREAGGYEIVVAPEGVTIAGVDDAGLFYGAVTLWQLATPWPAGETAHSIEATRIEDYPHFAWRGLMLDSARHFQSPAFVKQLIDWMALHKLNILHWHLTDDQGWRLEIKKYPRLTEIGAWRTPAGAAGREIDPATGDPKKYGGFYTQDEVREIVQYAAERQITIVPEIEMPGHALAPILAYPELGVLDAPPKDAMNDWGVYPYLFNVEESTFAFLEDVLGEVLALFPSEYIHIGGDEAVKDQWIASDRIQERMRELKVENEKKLQGYFTKRIEDYLSKNGRRLIGWDEILEGGLAPNATVMSWRGVEGAIEAARLGHDTVLSPAPTLYLDNEQSEDPDGQPGRGNLVTLETVYAFDPYPDEISEVARDRILGLQVNAWTEHMRSEDRVAYMAFPRAAAAAELGWTPVARRNWRSFVERMAAQFERYRALGMTFSDALFTVEFKAAPNFKKNQVEIGLSNQASLGEIRFTLDGSEPGPRSALYQGPLTLKLPGAVKARAFRDGAPLARTSARRFDARSLRRRTSMELRNCSNKLALSLEDDAPTDGQRAVFAVDIMEPCWIYEKADLGGVRAIQMTVGQVPFNFQIGDAVNEIVFRKPRSDFGEFEVRLDGCEGEPIAVLPLAPAAASAGVTTLAPAMIGKIDGAHDLCLTYTARAVDPIWTIQSIALLPVE